jgi:hypothetical protein
MARDDQEVIRIAIEGGTQGTVAQGHLSPLEVHRRNSERIHAIVDQYGWPGRTLVGNDASFAAWLVVQHMDDEPEFQERCLALMEAAFANGDVNANNLAYLTDRVLTNEGKEQMYGTQGVGVTSAEDETRVDSNRAAIGLEPWRAYFEKQKKTYAKRLVESKAQETAPGSSSEGVPDTSSNAASRKPAEGDPAPPREAGPPPPKQPSPPPPPN